MSGKEPIKRQLRMKKKRLIWATALIIILALAVTWAAFTDVIILRKTEDMAGFETSISILFVGNSQVFIGNVPKQLQTLLIAHGIDITYKDISRHGASLSDSKYKAISEIQSGRFDYVVLQEQSRRPQNDIEGFLEDVKVLIETARENGVTPVLYSPAWAAIDGRPDETWLNISTEAHNRAAEENDVILVNAGDAWIYAYQEIPEILLYTRFDPRGTHANNAGAFLTACVFAATLFDLHITEIINGNLYKGDYAIALAQVAWEFVNSSS